MDRGLHVCATPFRAATVGHADLIADHAGDGYTMATHDEVDLCLLSVLQPSAEQDLHPSRGGTLPKDLR